MSTNLETPDTLNDEFEDELKPGAMLLRDQYVIEQFLNNGGFGITYLAKDSLHRRVVIKECFVEAICGRSNSTVRVRSRTQAQNFRTIVDLFIAEARNIARLSHPNIVSVHQVFEDNDTAYIAMDFVEGPDLLEIVESPDFLDPEVVQMLTVKLLDAIEFIHREGIVHCDIAPDNILLRDNNDPVLIDFGAARDTATTDSRYLGAVRTVKDGYSPQEFYVADAQQYPSSDVYSFAASLYHVMTKELPHNAQQRLSAIASGDDDPYVSIKERVTGYPDAFLDAIDHALNVFPKERFQSAAEWRNLIVDAMSSNVMSGPTLAVDNETGLEEFGEASANSIRQKSDGSQSNSRRNSLFPESTFLEDAATIAASVKKSPTKGLFMGAATLAILAVVGAGVTLVSGDETDEVPSAPADAQIAEAPVFAPAAPAAEAPVFTPTVTDPDAPKVDPVANAALFQKSANSEPSTPNAPALELTQTQPAFARVAPAATAAPEPTATPEPEQPQLASAPATDIPNSEHIVSTTMVEFAVSPSFSDPLLIASVDGAAAGSLEPGWRILSLNGSPINAISEIAQLALDSSEVEVGTPVRISLGIENPATGEAFVRDVVLPTYQETLLSNGISFQTLKENDVWATYSLAGTGDDPAQLLPGDKVVALMPDNAMMDTRNALVAAISSGMESGNTQYSFAVDRDGDMWFVTMDFAVDE